ncbi:MAG: prepilin-type N-terminal cleavage/methylation domain-containing protein [Verrucomicrobiales bacterium]|jgi:prepilin-type N-terminal cleavage/methylation domain-containing protein
MKNTTFNKNASRQGFTLVEMIGVLAVVAILSAMLIPKIFETINTARVSGAASGIQTVKTAVANHYSKYGSFVDSTGTLFDPATDLTANLDADNFDTSVLLAEGMLERRFAVKIGDQLATNRVRIRTVDVAADPAVDITSASASYDLDGVGTVTTSDGALVCECIITGCSAADARDIKQNIDGSDITGLLVLPDIGAEATLGRVKYPAIPAGATGDVLIYVTHR